MRQIIALLVCLSLATAAEAQTYKSKKKGTKYKYKTSVTKPANVSKPAAVQPQTGTLQGTVPSGALAPSDRVLIIDSTTHDDSRYNPYRKLTPGEAVPEEPAPGFEDVNDPKNRLQNTDQLSDPR